MSCVLSCIISQLATNSRNDFFNASKGLDARVFPPQVQLAVSGYTMATNVVAGTLQHTMGDLTV